MTPKVRFIATLLVIRFVRTSCAMWNAYRVNRMKIHTETNLCANRNTYFISERAFLLLLPFNGLCCTVSTISNPFWRIPMSPKLIGTMFTRDIDFQFVQSKDQMNNIILSHVIIQFIQILWNLNFFQISIVLSLRWCWYRRGSSKWSYFNQQWYCCRFCFRLPLDFFLHQCELVCCIQRRRRRNAQETTDR